MKTIGVLTSSRADYGIYLPLLRALSARGDEYRVELIAFGTHLSPRHGMTIDRILDDGFSVPHRISCLPKGDSPRDIATSIGENVSAFSRFWSDEQFDLVFCLGDRYEMFAAVTASVPFRVTVAHLYGGEKTLGAIDDCFRHAMSHMSRWHFTSCERYRERVIELVEEPARVFNCGALGLDNLRAMNPLTVEQFRDAYGVDLTQPTLLVTFHPETVQFERNEAYARTICRALERLESHQVLVTMPNSDTASEAIRTAFSDLAARLDRVHAFENLGTRAYLSAMRYASAMVGNTSSGFVEASFFPKWVVNLGARQDGRLVTPNIRNTPIEEDAIVEAVRALEHRGPPPAVDAYGDGRAAENVLRALASILPPT